MPAHLSKYLLLTLAVVATAAVLVLSVWVAQESRQLSRWETDKATLRSADFGILDGDQWVSRLSPILAQRIENFEVNDENRPQMRALFTRVLQRLIDELPALLADVQNSGNSGGFFNNLLGNSAKGTVEMMLQASGIRDRVPQMADALIDELEKPETKRELVALMHGALTELVAENLGRTDRSALFAIQERYQCGSVPVCETELNRLINTANQEIQLRFLILCGLAASLLLLATALYRQSPGITGTLVVVGAAGLLAAGVLAPMIQIDARLAEFEFALLGDRIGFTDQVLYFQSKSILDVVEVLARSPDPEMLLVAVLIGLFSIGFPTLKLLTSMVLSWRPPATRPNALIRFFAWQSGKWAMADVFVVAIFLAYIGMRGLVNDQLSNLEGDGEAVTILSTNNTVLEPGFWAFLLFALFGIVLGMLVQKHVERSSGESG